MERNVAAELVFKTVANTKVAMAIAVASNSGYESLTEELSVTVDGDAVPLTELTDHHGGRFHYMEFVEPSEVTVDYRASVKGVGVPDESSRMELIRYVRPSRYAESDRLLPTSYAEFGGSTARNCCKPSGTGSTTNCVTSADPPGGQMGRWKRSCTARVFAGTSPTLPLPSYAPRTFQRGSPPYMPPG